MLRLSVLCAAAAVGLPSAPTRALAVPASRDRTGGAVAATITGRVTDATNGRPLANVQVAVVGTQLGTLTNAEGRYTIANVPDGQQTIRAILIGYAPQTRAVTVAGQAVSADFTMTVRASVLSEVVTVGYGTQRRQDVTGAVASVNLEDAPVAQTQNVGQILQGRVAGAQVTQNNGAPGGGISIQVRGSNSITATSEPLYVIDGIPAITGSGSNDAYQNPLSAINPSDIQSIEVLKDASSTAIYGARGANGVVLVTTRRGSRGESRLALEASYGTQEIRQQIPMLNGSQFAELYNEARTNAGLTTFYTPTQIASLGAGTNWQNQVLQTAPQQTYNLSASGGDDRTRYLLSGSYFDQSGIVIGSNFTRASARVNLERNVASRLQLGTNFTLSNTRNNIRPSDNGLGSSTVMSALWFNPASPVRNPDGTWVLQSPQTWPATNPVASGTDLVQRRSLFNAIGNVFGEYAILPTLRARSSLGVTQNYERFLYYAPRTIVEGASVGGDANQASGQELTLINENTLTYNRRVAGNPLDLLGGFTVQRSRFQSDTARNQQFPNDLTGAFNLNAGTLPRVGSGDTEWALLSWLGRVNYNVADRYLLTLTGRADGSSRFGENSKWGFFPSASAAWRIINEPFFKNQKLFDDLKLRLSYGVTGNQEIGLYNSLARLATTNYVYGNALTVGYSPNATAPNPDLKWEQTQQYNAGLDMGWLDNRITATVDAYRSTTRDLLLRVSLPASTGFQNQLQNVGSVRNGGVEASISTLNLSRRGFTWRTTFNAAANRNRVLNLGAATEIPNTDDKGIGGQVGGAVIVTRVGEPLGTFVGLRTNGLFQQGDQCTLTTLRPTIDCVPGEYKYVDTNGDGRINANDRVILGNAQPDWYGGLSNDFTVGPFTLNVFFQGVFGNEVLNAPAINTKNVSTFSNQTRDALNRWTPTNTNTNVPRANANRPREVYDVHVEDGSFIRLQTLTLGYTLPARLIPRAQGARVYVTGQNLALWTDYTGFDPEVNSFGGDVRARGIDLGGYPRARVWNFGLNLGF